MLRFLAPLTMLAVACGDLTQVPAPPVPLSMLEAGAVGMVRRPTPLKKEADFKGSLLNAVSPNALVSLHLPDLKGAMQRFPKTSMAKLLRDLGLDQAFSAGMSASLAGTSKQWKLTKGEVLLALEDVSPPMDGKPGSISLLLAVRAPGLGDKAQAAFELAGMAAASNGIKVEKGVSSYGDFLRLHPPGDSPPIELAAQGNTLLVGLGKNTVMSALTRMEGGETLSQSPAYLRAKSRIFHEDDVARVHVNLGRVLQKIQDSLDAPLPFPVRAIQLDKLSTVVGAIRTEGKNLVVSWRLDSPGGSDLITRVLSGAAADRGMVDLLPSDANSFTLFSLDLEALLDGVRRRALETEDPWFDRETKRLRESGVDLRKDIAEVFGPRGALANVSSITGTDTKALSDNFKGTIWILEVRDRERARALLARLPEQIGTLALHHTRINGADVGAYRFPDSDSPRDLSLVWTLRDGYLVVALSEFALKRVLGVDPLTPNRTLREAIEKAPHNASSIGYEDLQRTLPVSLSILLDGLAAVSKDLPFIPVNGAQSVRGSVRSFDPELSYMVADEGGILHVTRSPTAGIGGLGGLVGFLQVASVVLPEYLAERRNASEMGALRTLRRILDAQRAYRAAGVRDQDRDGDGEYGYLAELMGEVSGRKGPAAGTVFLRRKLERVDGGDLELLGYRFRVYLPADDGAPIGGHESPERQEQVDGDLAEDVMIVVAWPAVRGAVNKRAFLAEGGGAIYACDGPYEGDKPPAPDVLSSQQDNLACALQSLDRPARDGLRWERVR
ncbi:MAG: hypothetical protein O7C98_14545 [Planctomycetota bacterium]|nr:hypothetical protein [Planctomycetota bacterium]